MSSISAGTTSTTTLVHSGDTTGSLVFKTNDTGSGGTTAVTIDTSQRVGVGVTPSAWTTSIIQLKNSGYRASGNALGLVANAYYDGTWKYIATDYAQDYYQQDGAHVWRYAGLGTAGNAVSWTEAGRFDSSGNLQVGGQYAVPPTTSYGRITSTGIFQSGRTGTGSQPMMEFFNGNSNVGSIYTSGSNTSYNTSSDYRLKENIAPMTGALNKVAQLKPVTYKWKVDGADGEGFIAHELAEVCPQAVHGTKDAVDAEGNPQYQGIDVSFLVATLTAALQELKAINDTQAETINALTARVVALESK